MSGSLFFTLGIGIIGVHRTRGFHFPQPLEQGPNNYHMPRTGVILIAAGVTQIPKPRTLKPKP